MLTRRRLLQSVTLSLLARPRRSQAAPVLRPSVHPLNHPARCAGWWLASPLAGHAYWADLIHRRVGVTTGVTAGYGLQRSTLRVGGLGEVSFDGVDDVVTLPDLLDNPTTMSLSCWVRYTTSARALVTKAIQYSAGGPCWYLRNHGGQVGFWYSQDDTTYRGGVSTAFVNDDRWHHIAVAIAGMDPETAWMLWVDMQAQPLSIAGETAFSSGTITSLSNSEPVRLGGFGNGSDPYTGRLDDVRLAPIAWSATDVQTLFQAPRQQYRGLLAAEVPLVGQAPVIDATTRPRGLLFQ